MAETNNNTGCKRHSVVSFKTSEQQIGAINNLEATVNPYATCGNPRSHQNGGKVTTDLGKLKFHIYGINYTVNLGYKDLRYKNTRL
jgi:hypothetical protein